MSTPEHDGTDGDDRPRPAPRRPEAHDRPVQQESGEQVRPVPRRSEAQDRPAPRGSGEQVLPLPRRSDRAGRPASRRSGQPAADLPRRVPGAAIPRPVPEDVADHRPDTRLLLRVEEALRRLL